MVVKRKAVVATTKDLFKHSKGKSIAQNEGEDIVDKVVEEEEIEEQEQPQEAVSEESLLAEREAETVAARKKELKKMAATDILRLLSENGLAVGKKEDNIAALVKHEANARAEQREHDSKIRAVVVQKKEELEALSALELKQLCAAGGITGVLSKSVRVEKLIQQWQQEDGVDKALAKMARDQREAEFAAMDKTDLQKIAVKAGIDPYVKEVMIDRLIKCEADAGRFLPPMPEEEKLEETPAEKKGDMVEALLANEANRKKEIERKRKLEEAVANKRKELKAMSVEQLKKALKKRGLEPEGKKKNDMVEALFSAGEQEEKLGARRSELKAMNKDDLKNLVLSKGVQAGSRDANVEAIMAHEEKLRHELKIYAEKVQEQMTQTKKDLETKTSAELKEMCISKGLKTGVGKEERVERLAEEARRDGEIDKLVSNHFRCERKAELTVMDVPSLKPLCEAAGVDTMVKEVLIERLLEADIEPAAKRARSRK